MSKDYQEAIKLLEQVQQLANRVAGLLPKQDRDHVQMHVYNHARRAIRELEAAVEWIEPDERYSDIGNQGPDEEANARP